MKIFEILIARSLDKGGGVYFFRFVKEGGLEKFPYNYEKNF